MKTFEEICAIVREVKFRDWRFEVELKYREQGLFIGFLVIEFAAPCNVTGLPTTQRSCKWLLSPQMTKGEIVQTAFLAVKTALEHEAREEFQWRGHAIFGPHYAIDRLHELCVVNATEARPER